MGGGMVMATCWRAEVGFEPGLVITDWWMTLFSRTFEADVVGRLWDQFLLEVRARVRNLSSKLLALPTLTSCALSSRAHTKTAHILRRVVSCCGTKADARGCFMHALRGSLCFSGSPWPCSSCWRAS